MMSLVLLNWVWNGFETLILASENPFIAGDSVSVIPLLEWFVRDNVQEKWAELGGLSCHKKVLNSEKFLNASPINRPFKESIEMAKDFWAVPEYPQLLSISQKYWAEYVNEDKHSAQDHDTLFLFSIDADLFIRIYSDLSQYIFYPPAYKLYVKGI